MSLDTTPIRQGSDPGRGIGAPTAWSLQRGEPTSTRRGGPQPDTDGALWGSTMASRDSACPMGGVRQAKGTLLENSDSAKLNPMPRGPRLDAPGVLHHVMVRGIERRPIFRDTKDRADFLARLAALADAGEAMGQKPAALEALQGAGNDSPEGTVPWGIAVVVQVEEGVRVVCNQLPERRGLGFAGAIGRRAVGGSHVFPRLPREDGEAAGH